MIPQDEVGKYLSDLAARRENVARRLVIGDPIQRNLGSFYLIDDLGIGRVLGEIKPGTIPYVKVREVIRSNPAESQRLFAEEGTPIPEGRSLNFSRAVRAGFGQCVEKSTLLQLAVQDNMEVYFVMGALKEDGRANFDLHAFNIAPIGGKQHVIDAENPVKDEQDKEYPYIVVILGINEESGEIVVPENAVFGRRYYI